MVVQAQGERRKAGAVKAGGEGGTERRGVDGGEAGGLLLLLLERGRRGAVSWASGARVQVRQRRRWRPLSTGTGGGLSVQFCGGRAVSLGRGMRRGGKGCDYLPGTQPFRSVDILRPCRGHIYLSSRSSYGLLGSCVRRWPTPGAIRARARRAWRPAWHLR